MTINPEREEQEIQHLAEVIAEMLSGSAGAVPTEKEIQAARVFHPKILEYAVMNTSFSLWVEGERQRLRNIR